MAHNHPASQDVVMTSIQETSGKPHSPTLMDLDIQDRGYQLRRIPLPRTLVNKGRKKERSCYHAPAFTLSVPTFLHLCFLSSYYWICFLRNRCQRRTRRCPWALGVRHCLPLPLSRAHSLTEPPRTSSGAAPRPDLSPNYLGISKTVTLKLSLASMVVFG